MGKLSGVIVVTGLIAVVGCSKHVAESSTTQASRGIASTEEKHQLDFTGAVGTLCPQGVRVYEDGLGLDKTLSGIDNYTYSLTKSKDTIYNSQLKDSATQSCTAFKDGSGKIKSLVTTNLHFGQTSHAIISFDMEKKKVSLTHCQWNDVQDGTRSIPQNGLNTVSPFESKGSSIQCFTVNNQYCSNYKKILGLESDQPISAAKEKINSCKQIFAAADSAVFRNGDSVSIVSTLNELNGDYTNNMDVLSKETKKVRMRLAPQKIGDDKLFYSGVSDNFIAAFNVIKEVERLCTSLDKFVEVLNPKGVSKSDTTQANSAAATKQ